MRCEMNKASPQARTRLDRFIRSQKSLSKHDVRALLAQQKVVVDGEIVTQTTHPVDHFSHVVIDGQTLQNNTPYYLMLNKPVKVVSATKDRQHKTVIDLLDNEFKHELHIAGRLDLNSSGLLLLTNDSRWSRKLTDPQHKVVKRYRVSLAHPISEDYIQAFAEGMYFPYEGITTKPVELTIIEPHVAELCLTEGRYHQIKRMFGRFRNPVTALHRFAIGNLVLDNTLQPGQSRLLEENEINIA